MEIVMKKPTVPGAEKQGCELPPVYRGKPGPQGPAGTIEIAQVVTIEPSDPARVENIGDSTNAKIVIYLPKGDPGNPGRDGEPGKDYVLTPEDKKEIAELVDIPESGGGGGTPGGYYTPGVQQTSSETVKFSFTGSSTELPKVANIEITLPRGEKGEKGDTGVQGAQGPAGNDYILTKTDKENIAEMVAVKSSSVIVQPEKPTETGVLWLDTDDDESIDVYTKAEIDAMFGSYITDIDTLVGGDG